MQDQWKYLKSIGVTAEFKDKKQKPPSKKQKRVLCRMTFPISSVL